MLISTNCVDSFHELTVNIVAESDGTIKNPRVIICGPQTGSALRTGTVGKAGGQSLTGMTEEITRSGYSSGCTHLVDLVYDISQAVYV